MMVHKENHHPSHTLSRKAYPRIQSWAQRKAQRLMHHEEGNEGTYLGFPPVGKVVLSRLPRLSLFLAGRWYLKVNNEVYTFAASSSLHKRSQALSCRISCLHIYLLRSTTRGRWLSPCLPSDCDVLSGQFLNRAHRTPTVYKGHAPNEPGQALFHSSSLLQLSSGNRANQLARLTLSTCRH